MITSKPISTISYNTKNFLEVQLQEMLENDIIDFYAFIPHLPEKDEDKKPHIHLFVIPSTKINTRTLSAALEEPDLKNPDKPPLGVKLWRCSKFDDWYLYAEHNAQYLISKNQEREHSYHYRDFIVSDDSAFMDFYTDIDRSKIMGNEWLNEAVRTGVSFAHLVKIGRVPIQLIAQYERAYGLLAGDTVPTLNRNGRETHTPLNVDENGEIIDISKERFD